MWWGIKREKKESVEIPLMSTEVGSSSTANKCGDLALDITTMIESSKQQFSIGGVISVPDHLRKLDEQAFTPILISIGPIHHFNVNLQTMKKCKVLLCECFIQRAKINLQYLVHAIRDMEKEVRSYYTENIVSYISSDDFVTMILVDGMFILEYFLTQSNPHKMIAEWMHPLLKFDLVLLENQLPFFVLQMLFEQAIFPAELKIKPLRELAFEFFQCYNFQMMAPENCNAKIEHFTDLVRLFYLSGQLADRSFGGAKLSYSATQLHEVGVKLKGVKFDEKMQRYRGDRCFLDIRFDLDNGVLEIPSIKLNDEKVRLIRNIIALEQSFHVGHAYVTDFFVILEFLIHSSEDVDLLCDEGILVNYFGDSNAIAAVVNSLSTNILWDYMNPEYSKICENLNSFYKKRWHKLKASLWHQYFSTPWRAASTSAAIILPLLAAIQTVCSVKSTLW